MGTMGTIGTMGSKVESILVYKSKDLRYEGPAIVALFPPSLICTSAHSSLSSRPPTEIFHVIF